MINRGKKHRMANSSSSTLYSSTADVAMRGRFVKNFSDYSMIPRRKSLLIHKMVPIL